MEDENKTPSPSSILNPPPSPQTRLTAEALKLGAKRALILKAARPFFADAQQRYSLESIADFVGTSAPTLCRLRKNFAHLADDQLTPENCAGDFARAGRRSQWAAFAARADVQRRLQELYLLSCGASSDYMSKARRTGSLQATLDVFATDPLCPLELASLIQRGQQPRPLVDVIRRMNDLHEQKYRGQKHASLNGTLIQRRSLVEILADGSTQNLTLGDWWVFDDMSDNLPHWWEMDSGGDAPSPVQFIGRQGLYCYDVLKHWVGVEKLGTIRDSYTAAIILRFLRRLMQTLGKPRRGIVFERSVWMANTIRGVRLTTKGEIVDEEIERPAMADSEKALLQHGIEALGLRLHYTYTPRGKEIEGAFNYLQRLKPMVASSQRSTLNHQPVNVGRHAGEFEHAAKQVRRVRSGSHTPQELGFLHIEQSLSLDLQVMQMINDRTARKFKRAGDYPGLTALTERDLAVFLPEKRELELRNGKLTATTDRQPHDFTAPELFASLGSGYRLTLAFDPSEPTLGCALYNRETSSSNFNGWQPGEFIGWADYLAPVARFDWREGEVADPQAAAKRRFNKHIRTAFGAVGLNHRVSTVRDGKGNVATVAASVAAVCDRRPDGADTAPLQPRLVAPARTARREMTDYAEAALSNLTD